MDCAQFGNGNLGRSSGATSGCSYCEMGVVRMSDARDVVIYDKDGNVAAIVSCDSVAEAARMRDKLRDVLARAEADAKEQETPVCRKLN